MTTFTGMPIKGIDVSQFNGVIDWNKITPFTFAGIRVGYGRVKDKTFDVNWATAKGKIDRMPYWYGDYYSHNNLGISGFDWGIEQANNCYEILAGDYGELPMMLDMEASTYGGAINFLNAGKITGIYRAMMDEYDRLTGKRCGIYCSLAFIPLLGEWFKDRDLWIAWYNRQISVEEVINRARARGWRGAIRIWQYASDGDFDEDGIGEGRQYGMEGNALDLNVYVDSMQSYSAWAGSTPAIEVPQEPAPVVGNRFIVTASSGVNVRDVPIGMAGSEVIGWMPKGTVVTGRVVEVDNNTWLKITKWSVMAIRYNGIELMEVV